MAIINSYPSITPTANDLVLITDTSTEGNPTKTATIGSINAIGAAPDIITVKKTFTSTEIKTLVGGIGATNLTIVDAPGANKVIAVVSAVCFLNYNTTQYNFNADLELATKTNAFAEISFSLINSNADKYIGIPIFSSAGGNTLEDNGALNLQSSTAAVTTGDSPITFSISYRIIDFS